jgi:hypothetical protein
VFCQADGRPYHPERFSREFDRNQRYLRRDHPDQQMPRISLHGLRHTWATLALTAGIDIKIVSERLDHSSTHITREIYTHDFRGVDTRKRTVLFEVDGTSLTFDDLSGGEREIAFLLGQIERFRLRRGLLLIDEPELHLNPELLRRWLSYLRGTAESGQVWIATRCQIHKRRNVKGHLPARLRDDVDARLRSAFADPDPHTGLLKARRLAGELDKTHPDAAGSLREGLEDMFTVRALGIDGTLARTLVCTNMIESMISICRTTSGNVKRWRDEGDMRRRWCAAGLLEAERKFRRLRGHRQTPQLVAALARHAETVTPTCDTDHHSHAAA